jgi:hypothetical protein
MGQKAQDYYSKLYLRLKNQDNRRNAGKKIALFLTLFLCLQLVSIFTPGIQTNRKAFAATPTVGTIGTANMCSRTDSTDLTFAGSLASTGGPTVTSMGVVYGLNLNPTINDTRLDAPSIKLGYFEVSGDTGQFANNTTYHYRSFATNSEGTSYGPDKDVTTLTNTCAPLSPQQLPHCMEMFFLITDQQSLNAVLFGIVPVICPIFKIPPPLV